MAEVLKEDDSGGLDDKEAVEIELSEEEAKQEAQDQADDEPQVSHEDDDREAIRERRRQEKLERKERREKAITRDKLELDFLRKRNDDLERRIMAQEVRSQQSDIANLDAHIKSAMNDAQIAERVIAKAVEAQNGEDVAKAIRYRDEAIARANALTQRKKQQEQESRVQPQTGIDERTAQYAKEFIEENSWYDPQGRDEDSAIVLAIDSALVKDGYNPASEDYWDELRSRVERRLPDKFSANKSKQREARGGPNLGSGKEHAPPSTRKEVYISAERKQALIDAGVWDDPVLRQRYVKRYMEYDRNNRA